MNGLIVVNKDKDYTSRDVVNVVSNILHTKRIGHTGTLDPIATGVLVLTVGKCTKLCDYLTSEYKEYIAELVLGYETDTLDVTGNIVKTSDKVVDKDYIIDTIISFKGQYNQEVPKYSAVKINGRKLYEYARNNIEIELPSRIVDIKNIDIISIGDSIKIKCLVSKGTYIRSLIRDIGVNLGTYATMKNLCRIKLGTYDIYMSYKLDDIKLGNYKFIGIEDIFKDYPIIEVDTEEYKKISNGNELDNIYDRKYVLFKYENNLIAVYENKKSKLKPLLML